MVLLYLLFIIFSIFPCSANSSEGKQLLWLSNQSGLFSQFLQLRQMVRHAARFNRQLVVANFSSTHFNHSLSLCDVFVLPKSITCNYTRPDNSTVSSCLTSLSTVGSRVLKSNRSFVCFKGYLWGKKGHIPPNKRLQLMISPPRLSFQQKYQLSYQTRIFPVLPNSNGLYTVVHWRRGDQLTSRCREQWVGLKDSSTNCANVSTFISDIRSHPGGDQNQVIIVATNERNKSVLDYLRSASGFHVLDDIVDSSAVLQGSSRVIGISVDKSSSMPRPSGSELDRFVIESIVMLHAPVLVTLGISTINDLIESERQQRGLQYCTRTGSDESWCGIRDRDRGSGRGRAREKGQVYRENSVS